MWIIDDHWLIIDDHWLIIDWSLIDHWLIIDHLCDPDILGAQAIMACPFRDGGKLPKICKADLRTKDTDGDITTRVPGDWCMSKQMAQIDVSGREIPVKSALNVTSSTDCSWVISLAQDWGKIVLKQILLAAVASSRHWFVRLAIIASLSVFRYIPMKILSSQPLIHGGVIVPKIIKVILWWTRGRRTLTWFELTGRPWQTLRKHNCASVLWHTDFCPGFLATIPTWIQCEFPALQTWQRCHNLFCKAGCDCAVLLADWAPSEGQLSLSSLTRWCRQRPVASWCTRWHIRNHKKPWLGHHIHWFWKEPMYSSTRDPQIPYIWMTWNWKCCSFGTTYNLSRLGWSYRMSQPLDVRSFNKSFKAQQAFSESKAVPQTWKMFLV